MWPNSSLNLSYKDGKCLIFFTDLSKNKRTLFEILHNEGTREMVGADEASSLTHQVKQAAELECLKLEINGTEAAVVITVVTTCTITNQLYVST